MQCHTQAILHKRKINESKIILVFVAKRRRRANVPLAAFTTICIVNDGERQPILDSRQLYDSF